MLQGNPAAEASWRLSHMFWLKAYSKIHTTLLRPPYHGVQVQQNATLGVNEDWFAAVRCEMFDAIMRMR